MKLKKRNMRNLLPKFVRRQLRKDSETPVGEAAKQRLDKSSKLHTGYEAAFTDDMYKLLDHERKTNQRYQDEKVFGVKKEGPTSDIEDSDGMIIADDITRTEIKNGGGLLQTVGAMAVGGGILWGVLQAMQPAPAAPEPAAPQIELREFDYKVETKVIPPQ